MNDDSGMARRLLRSIRKEIPEPLAEGQDHDDAEVAAMLRELGIALIECGSRHNSSGRDCSRSPSSTPAKPCAWWCCRQR